MALACCFECLDGCFGERFLQLPSLKLRSMTFPEPFVEMEEILDFFSGCQGVFGVYTWATIRSFLQSLFDSNGNDHLRSKLCPSPEDDFIKHHLNKLLWEDAVKECPRATEITRLAQQLKPLLQFLHRRDKNKAEKFRGIICYIIGTINKSPDNYDNCVHTSSKDIAEGARRIIKQRWKQPPSIFITIEQISWKALLRLHHNWFQENFLLEGAIHVEGHTTLVRCTRSNHRVVVTRSFFIPMAEKTTVETRFQAVGAFCYSKKLLGDVGLVSDPHDGICRRLLTYAMNLESIAGDKTGFSHLPKGYCPPCPPNVLNVSKYIGAGIGRRGKSAFTTAFHYYFLTVHNCIMPSIPTFRSLK